MKHILLIKRRQRQKKPWYCTFCGFPLYNCAGGSGIYWCPGCRRWHHITLALVGTGVISRPFIEKILINRIFISSSMNAMIERMNLFLEENRKTIMTKVKIYDSSEYSQEFLKSLIPSLKEKKNEDKD